MRFEIDENWIYVDVPEAQGKKLDGVWNAKRKMYKLPNTLGALRELYKMNPTPELAEYGKNKAKDRQEFAYMKQNENRMFKYDERLRPYQRVDVSYLSQLPHAAIFNEQRTGKSPTALKLIELEGYEKVIIVCPASLLLNWKKEVEMWTKFTNVLLSKGTKLKREHIYNQFSQVSQACLIISYETLRNDLMNLSFKNFVMVVDEAHRLRNYKSKQSKALLSLGRLATKRLALTGTPAVNKGDDLFGILHFLYPNKFPSYWQFVERYFTIWNSPWGSKEVGKYKRKEELQEILDTISVQRKRKDVMKWLPPKTYQTIEVEMDAKQRKAYKDMVDTFIVEQDGEIKVDASSVLAQLTRLRQICLSPDLLEINAPSAKEQFILEWLEDNPEETVIIFSNFTSYLKELHKKVKGSVMIHGEMSAEQKQQSVNAIQTGRSRVLLANIISAGTGFNLSRASVAIFLDKPYTPVELVQAEDRIIPTTEEENKSCTIISLVVKDTIDEKINKLLDNKQSVIEVINNYKNVKEFLK